MARFFELKAGIWRHYKGHLYQVIGLASDASIPDRRVVVYIGLELEDAAPGPRMHVREERDFTGLVHVDEKLVPRFTYVGMSWGEDDRTRQ
jgi:hypothetical protein